MSVVYKGGHIVGKSGSVFATSSGGGSVPTNVQILLQGVDYPGEGNNTSTGVAPEPNHITVGWSSVASATSYNVYRSVNQGSYGSAYASVSATAAASNYSSYVSTNSSEQNLPIQTGVNCAYQDTSATNAVATALAATNGVYWPNTGYTYKVSAIVGGVESALSADSIFILFANGLLLGCQNVFDTGTVTWGSTLPATSPLGFTTGMLWQPTSGQNYINPFTGNSATNQNLAVSGFNYLIVNIYTGSATQSIAYSGELTGDQPLIQPGSFYYLPTSGNLPQSAWTTYKLSLQTIMPYSYTTAGNGYAAGTGVVQTEFYKITWGAGVTPDNIYMEQYFSVT